MKAIVCCWLIFWFDEFVVAVPAEITNNAIAIFLNNHFSGVCHNHIYMGNGSAHHKNRLSLDDAAVTCEPQKQQQPQQQRHESVYITQNERKGLCSDNDNVKLNELMMKIHYDSFRKH